MATTKVILQKDVPHLGLVGEMVTVKAGYARNFLIPQKMAIVASTKNIRQLEHQQRLADHWRQQVVGEAEQMAKKLESVSITLHARVGEQEVTEEETGEVTRKLYGSITTRDIEAALKEQGIEIERRQILLAEPIKALGVYNVDIKLSGGVTGKVKVWVVAEEGGEAAPESPAEE